MIILSKMLPEENLLDLLKECNELCRILQASIRTAQGPRREDASLTIKN
jgi:hypothetical protein